MTTFLDKLNLRPQERRLVVGGAMILFVVLQVWLVWPHWKDLRQVNDSLELARQKLARYQAEIARTNDYQTQLTQLEREGSSTLAEENAQPNLLQAQITAQAVRSRLNPGNLRYIPPSTRGAAARTNLFFEEQTFELGLNPSGDEEILDFLLAMGTNDLMIRVKELELQPDPSQTKLRGKIQLVASFQKNTAGRAAPKPVSAPPAKP